MDIRQIQYFLQICTDGSMSEAAKNLYISEQALSKSIYKLEQELGVKLFRRHNKGIELTDSGKEFQEEAMVYTSHHDYILQHFQAVGQKNPDTITIGVGAGLIEQWLSHEIFLEFIHKYPDITFNWISFSEDNPNNLRQLDRFDFILSTGLLSSPAWKIQYQAQRKMKIVLSKNHPLAGKEQLSLQDLKYCYVAMASDMTGMQQALQKKLESLGIEPNIRFSPSEIQFVNTLIEEANLICFFAGNEDQLPDHILCREMLGLDLTWNCYLLVREGKTLSSPIKELMKRIQDNMRGKT